MRSEIAGVSKAPNPATTSGSGRRTSLRMRNPGPGYMTADWGLLTIVLLLVGALSSLGLWRHRLLQPPANPGGWNSYAGLISMHRPADELAMDNDIRQIVQEHGRVSDDVSALARDADLYDAGMTSHASVSVMLALEDRFDVEFPERMLKRRTFESIAAITAAITELTGETSAV